MGLPLSRPAHRIPLWLKVSYTAFVAVLVPVYWYHYTPVNFLYFCDVALLVTVPALWLESSLLASMMAIAITLPQLVWQIDFISYLSFRVHFPRDFTDYMFQERRPLYLRGLSFFHFWLPLLLVWMVCRLGYDRRALVWQTVLGAVVLVLSYLLTTDIPWRTHVVAQAVASQGIAPSGPGAPAWPQALVALEVAARDRFPVTEIYGPAGNVNKVFGLDDETPQTSMPRLAWVGILVAAWTTVYLVTHLLFRWLMPSARKGDRPATAATLGAG
jgi:hypothetical protein